MRLLTEFEEEGCYADEENENVLEEMISSVRKEEPETRIEYGITVFRLSEVTA